MAAPARSRAVPLSLAVAGLASLSVAAYVHKARLDDTPFELACDASHVDKPKKSATQRALAPVGAAAPFTPLAWGANPHLTLGAGAAASADRGAHKRPTPLNFIGGTPLRDLVVHEKYGAAVDARGDLWMWGAGYDPSGEIGRSLRGKVGQVHLQPRLTFRNSPRSSLLMASYSASQRTGGCTRSLPAGRSRTASPSRAGTGRS
jgi:hypothetical protein